MSTLRAILVNAYAKTITEVQVAKGIEAIYKVLNTDLPDSTPPVRCFACIDIDGDGETAFVDDEGLLSITDDTMFIKFDGYSQPLVGNALILGTNIGDGESISSKLTIEQITKGLGLKFLTIHEVREGVAKGLR